MDKNPAFPRMAHLLARARHCREGARASANAAIAEALRELAQEFEAEAALQAACDDLLARREMQ